MNFLKQGQEVRHQIDLVQAVEKQPEAVLEAGPEVSIKERS